MDLKADDNTRSLLVLIREGQPVHVIGVGLRPVTIGRAPENDLVVIDKTVSRHHATIWHQGGKTWIRDHGTTNGSYINGDRITGAVPLKEASELRLGLNTHLHLKDLPAAPLDPDANYLLQDTTAGIQISVLPGDNTLAQGCILHLDGRRVTIHDPKGERAVRLGVPFESCGHRYVLTRAGDKEACTGELPELTHNVFAYSVKVTLSGSAGPVAHLNRLGRAQEHRVTAPNRVVLLCVLARKLRDDLAAGVDPSEAGWVQDNEIRKGIWGALSKSQDSNTLHVVLHRLRSELKKANFNAKCIEKGRGATRLLVTEVETE